MKINVSTPTLLKSSVESALFIAAALLLIVTQPAIAQAPIGTVDVSGGARGQGANSSLRQIQEMDAVRRELSELRDLIERQGYEFDQYKRKSDREILALREQLRIIHGAAGDGALNQIDGEDAGISLGGSEDGGGFDTTLTNSASNFEDQTVFDNTDAIDEEPEAAMIGVSMEGYGQPAQPTATSTTPLTLPAGSQAGAAPGFDAATGSYQQVGNSNAAVAEPAGNQATALPVTVEVVPAGSSATPPNQAQNSQPVVTNENLNTSGAWQTQSNPNGQAVLPATAGMPSVPPSNQQPVQNNNSDMQWQVIRSPGPRSAPLDETATGSQIEQPAGIQADSAPSQTQPSTDSVLGEL